MAAIRSSRQIDEIGVWQGVEVIIVVRSASDVDWSAVHVELAVANAVIPEPGECHDTVRHVFW